MNDGWIGADVFAYVLFADSFDVCVAGVSILEHVCEKTTSCIIVLLAQD